MEIPKLTQLCGMCSAVGCESDKKESKQTLHVYIFVIAESTVPEETEKQLELEINNEIEKLKYYLEQADDISKEGDFGEVEVINKRTTAIFYTINNLVVNVQELKIDRGADTPRVIRQWKKDTKDKYSQRVSERKKLSDALSQR